MITIIIVAKYVLILVSSLAGGEQGPSEGV